MKEFGFRVEGFRVYRVKGRASVSSRENTDRAKTATRL